MAIEDLLDSDGNMIAAEEGESSTFIGSLKNGTAAIDKASLITLVVTLYEECSGEIINLRNAQNILDANGGTVSSTGVVTLKLQPADNVIVSYSLAADQTEKHILRFSWTWNDSGTTRTGKAEFRQMVRKLITASPP